MPPLLRGALLCLALRSPAPGAALSCTDSSGAPADFWFGLKSGGCTNASSPLCSYFASYPPALPGALGTLAFTASLAGGAASALGATLSALAAARLANATLAVVHWNDDPPARFLPLPSTPGSFNAHAKGVLAADAAGGVWLTHSWPHFPDSLAFAPAWGIGEASTIYGQSFLCVSLPLPQVERLAAALLRMEPRVYDAAAPPALRGALPALSALAAGARNASYPLPTLTDLASAGGRRFLHVSKNGAWGGELYSGAVLPALGAGSLWVETWRRSPALASVCGASGSALNVASLNVTEGSGARSALQSYTVDHGKWAVSVCPALARAGAAGGGSRAPSAACPSDFRGWVCVGDINMMSSQSARGGGTVCFDHAPDLWAALVSAVAAVDTCNVSASSGALAASNSSSSNSSSSSGSGSNSSNSSSSSSGSGSSGSSGNSSNSSSGNSSNSSSGSSSGSGSNSSRTGSGSSSSGSGTFTPSGTLASSAYASSASATATASITSTGASSSSGTRSPTPPPPPREQLAQQQQGSQASPEQALLSAAAPIGYACAAAAVLGAAALSLARAWRLRVAKGRLTAASAAAGALPPRHAQWRVRDLLA
jgi:deoxyribonuclease-2